MRKKKTIAKLKKELDKVFNAFIRKRDSEDDVFLCISCGFQQTEDSVSVEYKPVSQMHAGHFYAGTFTATRWDERNVNGQCVGCNTFKHGNLLEYRKGMLAKYGQKVLDELEELHNKPFKLDRQWLEERIVHYKAA